MGRKSEACTECTQICQLLHGKKKDPSSMVTSFFKVMIGDDFSSFLFLPPKFARTVSALVGQNTFLEDSNGQKWKVVLSIIDGSFGFQKGWDTFSLDHGLEIGDFLVFNYVTDSHFIVQIYGRNGCQKLNFSDNSSSQRKRTKINGEFATENGLRHTYDKTSLNKQGSSTSILSASDLEITQSQHQPNVVEDLRIDVENASIFHSSSGRLVPRSVSIEDTCCIIDRDLIHKEGEDKGTLYDLSIFELSGSTVGVDFINEVLVEKEILPNNAEKSLAYESQAGLNWIEPSDASSLAMLEKNNNSKVMDKLKFISGKGSAHDNTSLDILSVAPTQPAKNGNDSMETPKSVLKESDNAGKWSNTETGSSQEFISQKQESNISKNSKVGWKKGPGTSEPCRLSVSTEIPYVAWTRVQVSGAGKKPMVNTGFGESIDLAATDNFEVRKVVKSEPVDSVDMSAGDDITVSCLVESDGQSFLELPACLPSMSLRGMRMDRKVVLLRDPVERLWPVLYHEKYGVKILKSGWGAFRKGSNIRAGDKCVFQLENAIESIYKVSVVRKEETLQNA